jgi:hypothetical protein
MFPVARPKSPGGAAQVARPRGPGAPAAPHRPAGEGRFAAANGEGGPYVTPGGEYAGPMTEATPLPLPDRLRLLAAWEDELADPEFIAGHWEGGEADATGAIASPWFDYAPAVERMHLDASTGGWVAPFDWMGWAATPEGELLLGDPTAIAGATADDLQHILTAVFRGERFADGAIAGAIERGVLLAVARRAGELIAEPQEG